MSNLRDRLTNMPGHKPQKQLFDAFQLTSVPDYQTLIMSLFTVTDEKRFSDVVFNSRYATEIANDPMITKMDIVEYSNDGLIATLYRIRDDHVKVASAQYDMTNRLMLTLNQKLQTSGYPNGPFVTELNAAFIYIINDTVIAQTK